MAQPGGVEFFNSKARHPYTARFRPSPVRAVVAKNAGYGFPGAQPPLPHPGTTSSSFPLIRLLHGLILFSFLVLHFLSTLTKSTAVSVSPPMASPILKFESKNGPSSMRCKNLQAR